MNIVKEKNIECFLEHLFDEYKLKFPSGDDFIQHQYSCNNEYCVEPAVGSKLDYSGVSLTQAKRLINYRKNKLRRINNVKITIKK